jgi:hypothetical protein
MDSGEDDSDDSASVSSSSLEDSLSQTQPSSSA